jgi:LacI family transcriptional regulator
MTARRITLLEVAQRAGVSRTTASFVLAGRRDMRISEAARQRVLRAAHELEYRPNLMARSLRTRMTQTIGLISDTIATEQYAGRLVYGSLTAALERQRLLYVGETGADPTVEERLVADFLDRQVDGFIYATMYTQRARIPRLLHNQPLVLLNCTAPGQRVPAVLPDELNGGRAVAAELLAAGHGAGIHLVGERSPEKFASRERLRGIEETLARAGVRLAGVLDCKWWPESAYETVSAFLAGGGRPAALICLNDRIALGAYQALHEAGLAIPADVSVLSFDDSDLAAWLRPQLTTVALPHHDLGRRAVELLLAAGGSRAGARIERLPMPLRRRGSVAPPKG